MRPLLLLCFLFSSSVSYAEVLSETELLYRCYAHLTSKRLKRSHPLLIAVKEKRMSAEGACLNLLNKAQLKSNGMLVNTSDVDSKAVLNTMTKLHMTFFQKQSLEEIAASRTRILHDIFDEQSLALHYTRALFDKRYDVDRVLKGKLDLEGVRSLGRAPSSRPTDEGPSSGVRVEHFTSEARDSENKRVQRPWPITFTQRGELLGLRTARTLNLTRPLAGSLSGNNILNSFGGGVLGARTYIKRTSPANNIEFDGALKMNRSWSNNVLKDFLCRELPAVRLADGQIYKKQNADAPFRKSDGCVRCHATMDQLAAGGRGVVNLNLTTGNFSAANPNFLYPSLRAVAKPASANHWPEKADKDYFRRPPQGALYFRSFDGELINKKFTSFDSLGQKLLETKDFYACVAKKYYRHFTGVDASLADINDPFSSVRLNEQELFHRKKVIALGEELQKTKNSLNLVKSILTDSVYKQKGYTFLGGQ